MCLQLSRYAPFLLWMAIVATVGCNRVADPPTSPTASTNPGQSITAEPALARPEFLPSEACLGRPAFTVRILVRLAGGFFVRGLRFHFIDDFGTGTLPFATAIHTPSGTQLPSSSPVPVPGIAALPPAFQAGGSSPFIVRFACGVFPEGTLFINADHDAGTVGMKVRIGD